MREGDPEILSDGYKWQQGAKLFENSAERQLRRNGKDYDRGASPNKATSRKADTQARPKEPEATQPEAEGEASNQRDGERERDVNDYSYDQFDEDLAHDGHEYGQDSKQRRL